MSIWPLPVSLSANNSTTLLRRTFSISRTRELQPDTDLHRRWEVAGTSHSGWIGFLERQSVWERDQGRPLPVPPCDKPAYARIPAEKVYASVHHHMVRWARDGTAPPVAPPLTRGDDGLARTEHGNAKGGIQLADRLGMCCSSRFIAECASGEQLIVHGIHLAEERRLRVRVPRPNGGCALEEHMLQEVRNAGRPEPLVHAADIELGDEGNCRGALAREYDQPHPVLERDLPYRKEFSGRRLSGHRRCKAGHD
mgnify:CR=1 FL=1